MRVGIVGLGRMGSGIAQRLLRGGHEVVGHSRRPEALSALSSAGGEGTTSPDALIERLPSPRVVWMMVPAGEATETVFQTFRGRLAPGDFLIDGGNAHYKDSIRRGREAAGSGIKFIDAGVSGGIWGLSEGFSLMLGGRAPDVQALEPLWRTLAPTPDSGWGRVGESGAGHFVKMVHNGIEYGLMESYAEGFALLDAKREFALDLGAIAAIWQRGSVVRSWLLDLLADALKDRRALDALAPFVEDSGEGRWTAAESIDLNVSAPVILTALERRIRSREPDPLVEKILAALRKEFGGHSTRTE